eukprot:3098324-Amphidinium_carterae.1
MLAHSPSGSWPKRGMSTQDAQLRLRGLVGKWGCHDGEVKTHSLETTLLLWSAKVAWTTIRTAC